MIGIGSFTWVGDLIPDISVRVATWAGADGAVSSEAVGASSGGSCGGAGGCGSGCGCGAGSSAGSVVAPKQGWMPGVADRQPVDLTAEGYEYERGFFFDYCTGDAATGSAADRRDVGFEAPWNRHVFGQLDDVPRENTPSGWLAGFCQCSSPIPLSAAPHYAEQMCQRKAQEAGYECGYAANIEWFTCHVECEFATGKACLGPALNRLIHGATCPFCYPSGWARWAATACFDIFPEWPQFGGLAYAYCGHDEDGGCVCFYKCNLTPEVRGTCGLDVFWKHG